jgi:hypothetical protein
VVAFRLWFLAKNTIYEISMIESSISINLYVNVARFIVLDIRSLLGQVRSESSPRWRKAASPPRILYGIGDNDTAKPSRRKPPAPCQRRTTRRLHACCSRHASSRFLVLYLRPPSKPPARQDSTAPRTVPPSSIPPTRPSQDHQVLYPEHPRPGPGYRRPHHRIRERSRP